MKENKRCQVCDKEFEAKNYWQKYCSKDCKLAMWAVKRFNPQTLKKIINNIKNEK